MQKEVLGSMGPQKGFEFDKPSLDL